MSSTSLICPLTLSPMKDPVFIHNHCFEKKALEIWLKTHSDCPISPLKALSVNPKNLEKYKIDTKEIKVHESLKKTIQLYQTSAESSKPIDQALAAYYKNDLLKARELAAQVVKEAPHDPEGWKLMAALQMDESQKIELLLTATREGSISEKDRKLLLKMILLKDPQHTEAKQRFYAIKLPSGKAKMEKFLGNIGRNVSLPEDIGALLQENNPFLPDQKIYATCTLTLISDELYNPEILERERIEREKEREKEKKESLSSNQKQINSPSVETEKNPKELCLSSLQKLSGHPKKGDGVRLIDNYNLMKTEKSCNQSVSAPYYYLMLKYEIPGTQGLSSEEYNKRLTELQAANPEWAPPQPLEANLSILMHYFRTGEHLFAYDTATSRGRNMICPTQLKDGKVWHVTVGNFYSAGLGTSCANLTYEAGNRWHCMVLGRKLPLGPTRSVQTRPQM